MSLEKKLNEDFLTKILIQIFKSSNIDDELDMVNKHIEICINDLEYKYKHQENLRKELIKIVEEYIQYGNNSIDFYTKTEDILKKDHPELYETGRYLQNKYDPDNTWEVIKSDLQNLVYKPILFNDEISRLKYEIRLNMENEELEKWEKMVNSLEMLKKDNTENFISMSEEVITDKKEYLVKPTIEKKK
jgi:hypothetical protein